MSNFKSLVLFLATMATLHVKGVAADTCGDAEYSPSQYYCFDGNFLCPKVNGEQYLRCGDGCYSASQYEYVKISKLVTQTS